VNGNCALCAKSAKLIDSHFMPKAVYRSMSKSVPESGQKIVWISGFDKSAAYTDKQAKRYLLCKDCESKFSRNGERVVLELMARYPDDFKLHTKIQEFEKLDDVDDEIWYFPPSSKDFALGFIYFAISIAWRHSSTDWKEFGLPNTKGSIRNENMVAFTDFLLGKTNYPCNTYLAVYVDNQIVDMPTMGFPTVKDHKGYQHIVFHIPGIKFSIVAGKDPGAEIKEVFSQNEQRVYFISRSFKSHPDNDSMISFIKNEVEAKGRLQKERSKNV